MQLLPTKATVEAPNVSTDRRHPFHTCNDHNRFRQFRFTQQKIVVDIDDVERDTEISNGKGSLRLWCLGYSQCFLVIPLFWYNSFLLQHKQTYLFLSYLSPPAIIQTNSSLAWVVLQNNMYMDEPELCHWFIKSLTLWMNQNFATDSLNRSLLE